VNCARIAVGGLVLAEITGGMPAVPAYAATPVVLASSHHSTDGDKHHAKKHHHTKHHHAAKPATKAPVVKAHAAKPPVRAAVAVAATSTPVPQPAPAAAPEVLYDHYIVQPGDTLTHIAAAYQVDWASLWSLNTDQVYHPDAIYPGLRLRLPA
jgi:nucleoid-associated protein YgaU